MASAGSALFVKLMLFYFYSLTSEYDKTWIKHFFLKLVHLGLSILVSANRAFAFYTILHLLFSLPCVLSLSGLISVDIMIS